MNSNGRLAGGHIQFGWEGRDRKSVQFSMTWLTNDKMGGWQVKEKDQSARAKKAQKTVEAVKIEFLEETLATLRNELKVRGGQGGGGGGEGFQQRRWRLCEMSSL